MNAHGLLPAPFDRALKPKEVHSCYECERHIAIAERELGSLLMAVQNLYGAAEADLVAQIWLRLAEDPNIPSTDGYPEWRCLTTTAIEQLAESHCLRENQQQQGE